MSTFELKINAETVDEGVSLVKNRLEKDKGGVLALNTLKGKIDKQGHFSLTSRARGAAFSQFEGQVIKRSEGVFLEGDVHPISSKLKLLYGLVALNAVLAGAMFLSGNPIFQLFGVFFLVIPWLNVSVAKKGNYLRASLKKIFRS